MSARSNAKNNPGPLIKILIVVVIVAFTIGGAVMKINNMRHPKKEVSYNVLVEHIEKNDVSKLETNSGTYKIEATLKDGSIVYAYVPSINEFWEFVENAANSSVEIKVIDNNGKSLTSSLISLIYYGLIGFFLYRMITKMQGNDYKPQIVSSNTRFSDVAGIDEERNQLAEVVEFLKNPNKYRAMGARIPRGILLVGPPGTGKTLLAKAVAGEAGVPFFQVTGSSFEEKFVGVGASRVRKIFDEAKKVAPAIIFIDEIDAVARNRYSQGNYSEQTLNQLLAEMDGFDSRKDSIIVIAATNHKEVLDPAILRPGRFDRHVYVPLPNVKAREEILRVHARNKKFYPDVDFKEVAKMTVGFSGANLENILNEAALYAVNIGIRGAIPMQCIDEAIAREIVGIKKNNSILTPLEKRLTAIHEAGHAIVSTALRPDVKNFCISIVPRGSAGGYNFFDESYHVYSQMNDIMNQIAVLYGGRAAEEVILGDISNGASNDLEKATQLAYTMVMKYAMASSMLVKVDSEGDFNKAIEGYNISEIEKICFTQFNIAKEIVEKHKETIIKLAALLEEREYLSENEVSAFMAENIFGHC